MQMEVKLLWRGKIEGGRQTRTSWIASVGDQSSNQKHPTTANTRTPIGIVALTQEDSWIVHVFRFPMLCLQAIPGLSYLGAPLHVRFHFSHPLVLLSRPLRQFLLPSCRDAAEAFKRPIESLQLREKARSLMVNQPSRLAQKQL
jgi:hypothetical protein